MNRNWNEQNENVEQFKQTKKKDHIPTVKCNMVCWGHHQQEIDVKSPHIYPNIHSTHTYIHIYREREQQQQSSCSENTLIVLGRFSRNVQLRLDFFCFVLEFRK